MRKIVPASLRPLRAMNRLLPTKSSLRRSIAAVLLVPALTALAGCGGDESDKTNDDDATALIEKAFDTSIESADLNFNAQLEIEVPGTPRPPVRVTAKGPFRTNGRKLPKVDLDLTLGAQGQGQTLQGGFLSTGDRAFVKFGGEYYEQPKARVDAANRDLAREQRGGKPLLDPGAWVVGAKMKGEDEVAGVPTEHVTARIDVRKLLEDLNELARKGSNAVGGQTAPEPLSQQRLDDAVKTVKDPTFDIYVGKEDGAVHRMSGNLTLLRARGEAQARAGQRRHVAVHRHAGRHQRRPEDRGAGQLPAALRALAPDRRRPGAAGPGRTGRATRAPPRSSSATSSASTAAPRATSRPGNAAAPSWVGSVLR